MSKRILVTGGTGTIGAPLVKKLIEHGAEVVVLTRSSEKARKLPKGATALIGAFEDISILKRGLQGCDSLFLNCEIGPSEFFQGVIAADLAKRAGIRHIVYLSGQDPESLFLPPHCGVKVATERAIAAMAIDYTFLRPNTFMQNDLNIRDALLFGGIYALPYGDGGVWRVDARDIADVAAKVLLHKEEHVGKFYNLVGPERQTGQSLADEWSKALNRSIKYAGDDLEEFESMLCQNMQAIVAHDIRMIFEHYQSRGLHSSEDDLSQMQRLLGRPPRKFSEFAMECANSWEKLPPMVKVKAGLTALKMTVGKNFQKV